MHQDAYTAALRYTMHSCLSDCPSQTWEDSKLMRIIESKRPLIYRLFTTFCEAPSTASNRPAPNSVLRLGFNLLQSAKNAKHIDINLRYARRSGVARNLSWGCIPEARRPTARRGSWEGAASPSHQLGVCRSAVSYHAVSVSCHIGVRGGTPTANAFWTQ